MVKYRRNGYSAEPAVGCGGNRDGFEAFCCSDGTQPQVNIGGLNEDKTPR